MTDHRATDLSYGHLGELSYDVDEHRWCFPRDLNIESCIQPLRPLRECITPSLRTPPDWSRTDPNLRSFQSRWLQKNLPEFGSAKAAITTIRESENIVVTTQCPSSLFALGKASDLDQTTGTRSIKIMAMVHGEARNLLRLIKPRVEALKWDGQHGSKLQTINPDAAEDCYWLGEGGAIQQITFGADSDGFTSWLAVLKAESITILRPIYRRDRTASSISLNSGRRYPPSCLSPNQILRLGIERTGPSPNADVSFNPWYIRQFATINQKGYWAIWDIEGQKQKRTTFRVKPGKSGHIQDDPLPGQRPNLQDSNDGWGRILWAGSFKTLLLCDRRNFTIFDLKTSPKRLYSPDLVHAKSVDWILDMKRSPINLNHVFVLTTRQIFWLLIIEAGESTEQASKAGAKILLSCQHFRNLADGTAKLDLQGDDEACTIFLYALQSPLISTYRFATVTEDSFSPVCSQGSFVVKLGSEESTGKAFDMFQTLCLISASFMLQNQKPLSGPAKHYADHNVHFYQLFGFSETLRLYQTLCATKLVISGESNADPICYQTVLPPMIKDPRVGKVKTSSRYLEDYFMVPDGLEEEEEEEEATPKSFNDIAHSLSKSSPFDRRRENFTKDLCLTIDSHLLFRISFLEREPKQHEDSMLSSSSQNMARYSEMIQSCVERRKELGLPGLTTFLEMIGNISFLEDIDVAASILTNLIKILRSDDETTGSMVASLLMIQPSPSLFLGPLSNSEPAIPGLSDVYDKLINMWVSCLPRRTPGPARLAKEKLVRTVAAEICLSAMGIVIRQKSRTQPTAAALQDEAGLVLPVRNKLDPFERMDQFPSHDPSIRPVQNSSAPVATPSMPPNDSNLVFQELPEDEAISRLRCYALSIKTQPPLGTLRSAILSHWPSTPGADPSKYSWEASHKAIAEDQGSDGDREEARVGQREEARRRRRIEKFLKRQPVNMVDVTSQPLPQLSFGGQPDSAQHPVSSQGTNVPMTQPDRGVFGSRRGPKNFKKRRTMGF